MARKVYPDEVQARAVLLYLEYGAAEASKRVGVPAGTIRSWASRNDVATQRAENVRAEIDATRLRWEERRVTMAERIGAVAEKALDVTEQSIDAGETRTAKEAATTLGILIDKAQLLTGAATARTEHSSVEAARAAVAALVDRRSA